MQRAARPASPRGVGARGKRKGGGFRLPLGVVLEAAAPLSLDSQVNVVRQVVVEDRALGLRVARHEAARAAELPLAWRVDGIRVADVVSILNEMACERCGPQ